jgi:RimJ/RimL family protein N-acetyltransferase
LGLREKEQCGSVTSAEENGQTCSSTASLERNGKNQKYWQEPLENGDVDLLEGKNVNLKIAEKEDLSLLQEWWKSLEFSGIYNPMDEQRSRVDIEKEYEKLGSEKAWFLILKKDGSKIGFLGMRVFGMWWQIGYVLVPSERGKGYCTEAVQIALDYLFLSKDIVRVQAGTFSRALAGFSLTALTRALPSRPQAS